MLCTHTHTHTHTQRHSDAHDQKSICAIFSEVPRRPKLSRYFRRIQSLVSLTHTHIHTHTRLTALCPGLPRWAGTRIVKPIWILLKQETVSGSGISWATCKSASRSRQITIPAPQHSVFYRPDALPVAQTTASKHWRHQSLVCTDRNINSITTARTQ